LDFCVQKEQISIAAFHSFLIMAACQEKMLASSVVAWKIATSAVARSVSRMFIRSQGMTRREGTNRLLFLSTTERRRLCTLWWLSTYSLWIWVVDESGPSRSVRWRNLYTRRRSVSCNHEFLVACRWLPSPSANQCSSSISHSGIWVRPCPYGFKIRLFAVNKTEDFPFIFVHFSFVWWIKYNLAEGYNPESGSTSCRWVSTCVLMSF
jgi:hypothetical protein